MRSVPSQNIVQYFHNTADPCEYGAPPGCCRGVLARGERPSKLTLELRRVLLGSQQKKTLEMSPIVLCRIGVSNTF